MKSTSINPNTILLDIGRSSIAVGDQAADPVHLVIRLPSGRWRRQQVVYDHVGALVRSSRAQRLVILRGERFDDWDERIVIAALLRLRAEYGFELVRQAPERPSQAPDLPAFL